MCGVRLEGQGGGVEETRGSEPVEASLVLPFDLGEDAVGKAGGGKAGEREGRERRGERRGGERRGKRRWGEKG